MHSPFMNWWSGYPGWHFGWLFMVLFWFLVILGAIYLFRTLMGKSGQKESALDILKRRYAAGEISKEQFEQMKQNILS